MMIYVFGDLRQLRSFELARPAISQPKPLPPEEAKKSPLNTQSPSLPHQSQGQVVATPVAFSDPFPEAHNPGWTAGWNISSAGPTSPPGAASESWMSRKMSLPSASGPVTLGAAAGREVLAGAKDMVPRKMSLPAVLSGWGLGNRSKERVGGGGGGAGRSEEESVGRKHANALQERRHMLLLEAKRAPALNDAITPLTRPPALTIVPPEPVHFRVGKEKEKERARRWEREEVGPLEKEDEGGEEVDDEGYTSEESYGSEEESESEEEEEEEEEVVTGEASKAEEGEEGQKKAKAKRRRRRRRPLIEVSDVIYDEHPSPEGPATAPADWFPSALERRNAPAAADAPLTSARRASVSTNAPATGNPLWPDYKGSADGHPRAAYSDDALENPTRTAVFIQPYPYESASSAAHGSDADADGGILVVPRRGVGREGEKARDVEATAAAQRASAQGVREEFDFDGLPPVPALKFRTGAPPPTHYTHSTYPAGHHRPPSPAPSASTRSEIGSAIDRRGRWWVVRRWWWFVEKMQRRCSPENVVEVLRRKSEESVREERGGGEGEGEGEGERGVGRVSRPPCARVPAATCTHADVPPSPSTATAAADAGEDETHAPRAQRRARRRAAGQGASVVAHGPAQRVPARARVRGAAHAGAEPARRARAVGDCRAQRGDGVCDQRCGDCWVGRCARVIVVDAVSFDFVYSTYTLHPPLSFSFVLVVDSLAPI